MTVRHLTKAGVINILKSVWKLFVKHHVYLLTYLLTGSSWCQPGSQQIQCSQVTRCNQLFPCSGPSDIYATVDGTVVRQSNVLCSLERKTSGVTAHYGPVQHMTSLVRWYVYELNQIVVVQQSLQLVNIAIEKSSN